MNYKEKRKERKRKISLQKYELIQEFARKPGDTGSPEVRLAILKKRIRFLGKHIETHKKDYISIRSILLMKKQRNRLVNYIKLSNLIR